ncbi:putative laminin domain protein [Rhizoctonia solani 123E]|uniref:Putative laminin domain protein n=1 Tax=Rhizoctonia solani 123E TaxID=1423351 RepID=A0A074RNI4_9AGAM|nr:putative laminin domain protein [Rhizoctonia solani 123E]
MAEHTAWYPPGQVCYPPELPIYLRNVYDLKPIVGVPSDADVIGVHAVIQAANRVSGVPGMHDPGLLMGLADHLFSVQMARYRSKYSLITFPSDATYVPPELPAHVSVKLEPVSGAPSDDEVTRVQEALRLYQQFSHAPSMFDAHVNMELSQHLFNLQMARYMRVAGECHASPVPQTSERPGAPVQVATQSLEGPIDATNNAGTGASAVGIQLVSPSAPGVDVRELMERSNQLADRFNRLLEHSNKLTERCSHPAHETSSQMSSERFNQVLERLTQLFEQSSQPAGRSDRLTECFDQLLERFNHLVEQSNESNTKANELADRANQLAEKHNESSECSNRLSEQANKSWERLGGVLGNINKVLVRIQHAIVRNHKGNTIGALDCLVNEKGETPPALHNVVSLRWLSERFSGYPEWQTEVRIDGAAHKIYIPDAWLGLFLYLYGIGKGLCESEATTTLLAGKEKDARARLSQYFSSCLG